MNNQQPHVSKMSGKMLGIPAMSTSCLSNGNCAINRKVKGSICSKCFSVKTQAMYERLQPSLDRNLYLTKELLAWEELPYYNSAIFRLEAFGDLINKTHLLNYVRIAEKNPQTTFTLWTKRRFLADQLFDKYPKPSNFKLIYSSIMIDQPVEPGDHADKSFTVYSKPFIKEHSIKINCGSRDCMGCRLCYTDNEVNHINEVLK